MFFLIRMKKVLLIHETFTIQLENHYFLAQSQSDMNHAIECNDEKIAAKRPAEISDEINQILNSVIHTYVLICILLNQ